MTTPENITSLKQNQIFVFGSNLNGNHAGGAAKLAQDAFGAIGGQGEGLMGQSYAFPTLDQKMKRVTKKDLLASKERLYACAKENGDKTFLVTKLGCGIAGFSESEMKKIFSGEKPQNIILPPGWAKVYGYKAFESGLKCRGFQYELGKDFKHDGAIRLCESGFHFCKSLGEVYSYYNFGSDIVVAEIESEGEVIDEEDGNKSVTNHLRITRILNAQEAANNSGANNVGHSNTGDSNTGHRNTGDSNTGHRNTGDSNTGDSNTGDSNTGDWNTGDSNTGDSNTGDWNTGDSNTGNLNTITPDKVLVFNKECKRSKWNEANKPSWMYFNLTEWIDFSDMTDEEKVARPQCKTQGGYLKKWDYKEAFKNSYDKASESEQKAIKKLPNWDKKVFFEISGIMID